MRFALRGIVRAIGAVLVLSLVLASPLLAQDPSGGSDVLRKQAMALRVDAGAIRVDGRLDDEAWNRATPITDFVQKEPNEGAPPTESMEVRFTYDAGALYVGARMHNLKQTPIQAPMGQRDGLGDQSEHIFISLDTFLDHRTAYTFGVTASGVRLDRFHPQDDEANADAGFDPVWEAKTRIDVDGWTAELWIPFAQLRFNDQPEQTWGLNVRRYTPTLEEQDYWVLVPRTVRAWASRFGELRGLQVHPTRRTELLPFIAGSSKMNANRDIRNPFDNGRNLGTRIGADLKVGLGPNLTLDAALNPDFGQVEADAAEVNLTAFATRFPEKRPFFTEGARLLNLSHPNVFYSRRIGIRPSGPASGDFVDYPEDNTILAAGKITGRLPSGTSIGVLSAVTDQEFARVSTLATPGLRQVRVAPRTFFGLARVQQEFGRSRSTASFLVGTMHRAMDLADPLAALLARNALVYGGDALLRFKGGQYELSTAAVGAHVTGAPGAIERIQRSSSHYMQRPDKTYGRLDPARTSMTGFSTTNNFNRTGGSHWLFGMSAKIDTPGYESNDIAQLNGADGIQPSVNVTYRETQPGRIFRNYSIRLAQSNEWNFGGERQAGAVSPTFNATLRNFWTTQISLSHTFEAQDALLTRGGPIMGRPGGWNASARLSSSAAAQTTWSGTFTANGDDLGGKTRRVNGNFSFRPGPRWQVSAAPTYDRTTDSQQYVDTVVGGRSQTYGNRYIFSYIERSTFSAQFRLNYTLKPDLNLDVYAEPFSASGRYYDYGELLAPRSLERLTNGASPDTSMTLLPNGSRVVTEGAATFTLANRDFNVRSFRSNMVLRWEWRPGSTLYAVWQQDRRTSEAIGNRVGLRDLFGSIRAPGSNYFVVKTSFWLPLRWG